MCCVVIKRGCEVSGGREWRREGRQGRVSRQANRLIGLQEVVEEEEEEGHALRARLVVARVECRQRRFPRGKSPLIADKKQQRFASESPATAASVPSESLGCALSPSFFPCAVSPREDMKSDLSLDPRRRDSPEEVAGPFLSFQMATKTRSRAKRRRAEAPFPLGEDSSPAKKGQRREEDNPLRKMEQMTCSSLFESSSPSSKASVKV